MTHVKICGLTERAHVEAARGADAVGFVVASPRSHRNLSHEQARALVEHAGPLQVTVAVTAARDAATLEAIVREVRPHALQAPHGAPLERLRGLFPSLRLLLACRPEEAPLVKPGEADAVVLDAARADGYGGTGARLDLAAAREARRACALPVLLAGGLAADNVAEAIRAVGPYGVDVSSGVETDRRKDVRKILQFIDQAKEARSS